MNERSRAELPANPALSGEGGTPFTASTTAHESGVEISRLSPDEYCPDCYGTFIELWQP
jgi:hypothetical protein